MSNDRATKDLRKYAELMGKSPSEAYCRALGKVSLTFAKASLPALRIPANEIRHVIWSGGRNDSPPTEHPKEKGKKYESD